MTYPAGAVSRLRLLLLDVDECLVKAREYPSAFASHFTFGALPPSPISPRPTFEPSPLANDSDIASADASGAGEDGSEDEGNDDQEEPSSPSDEAAALGVYIGREFATKEAFHKWARGIYEKVKESGCALAEQHNKA